jgi:peptidyl-prolyl cis-trans isomerase SurA
MKRIVYTLLAFWFFSQNIFAQSQNNDILFAIAGNDVPVSEFLYIYKKNLGNKADFSRKSLEEYLDLYIKFKLKVQKAKDMNLDKTNAFKKEMAGYREQLAKSYLVDKEVSEKLMRETYDRMQKDLKVSHILISTGPGNKYEEKAKQKVNQIYNDLKKGESFSELAKKYSDDKYSKNAGGDLGWVTAMLPEGFYEFENRIYSLKPGEFSKPFRTKFGYHIVKLENERPARGEIEASHILIRDKKKGKPIPGAKAKIDSIYDRLVAGENFVQLARKYSMDNKTAIKGGYLGYFGINKYGQIFEDQAFSLKNNNDFTKPFKTVLGWHIIKRMSKPGIKPYDKVRKSLINKINKNERFEIARKALIEKIKKEAGFKEYTEVLDSFISKLDKSFYSFKWKAPEYKDSLLFQLGNENVMLGDFVRYIESNQRKRIQLRKKKSVEESLKKFYDSFVADKCIKYEESHLEEKYPDFKFLMQEYTEGNLLFEVMEKEVWNKASSDTTGLKKFYEENKEKYQWKPRAELYTYTIHSDNPKLIKKVLKYIKKRSHKKLIKKFNKKKQLITFKIDKLEINSKELKGMKFKESEISEPFFDKTKKIVTVKKISKIIPKSTKSLDEAKGYVIADYQEYLEKKWLESLQKEYKVVVNKQVFESLIQK